ncbi:hypothetical protein FOZ62_024601, partial [Perkinsus olseni]
AHDSLRRHERFPPGSGGPSPGDIHGCGHRGGLQSGAHPSGEEASGCIGCDRGETCSWSRLFS